MFSNCAFMAHEKRTAKARNSARRTAKFNMDLPRGLCRRLHPQMQAQEVYRPVAALATRSTKHSVTEPLAAGSPEPSPRLMTPRTDKYRRTADSPTGRNNPYCFRTQRR